MEAAREFDINESTVRGIKRQYWETCTNDDLEITSLPVKKQGRPLLLGSDIDEGVKKYIQQQRSKGAVITRFTVIAIARAIFMRHNRCLLSEFGGRINLTKQWAQSILHRMKYVKRRGSTKVHVTSEVFERLRDEFLSDIKITVMMEEIPSSLVINWDQTGISIVPGSSWSMAPLGSRRIEIAGMGDKRQITAGTLDGNFLPMQLIYAGKTSGCHPKGVAFPSDWQITHTHKSWANEDTMNDYVRHIIIPYVEKTRGTNKDQSALVIIDVFKGQLCQSTMDLVQKNNIHFVHVPPNCTDRLQPLDVSVNKSCKDYMKKQFVDWYSEQILQSLDDDTDFTVDLRLSVMKPLGTKWLISFFNYIINRPNVVFNGFKASGIAHVLNYSMMMDTQAPPTS